MTYQDYCDYIRTNYPRLHPRLYALRDDFFAPSLLRAVRTGGHVALIGVLSGYGQFNPLPILMKGVRVTGIYVGSREMFEDMNRAIALNRLKPVVDRVFDFADAVEALKHVESGAHFGKVVIRVAS